MSVYGDQLIQNPYGGTVMRRNGSALLNFLIIGSLLVILLGSIILAWQIPKNTTQASEMGTRAEKERASATLTETLLNTPTELPAEWQAAVTYLSDAQPLSLPEGWIPVIVVKRDLLFAQTSTAIFLTLTVKGEFQVLYHRVYDVNGYTTVATLDVGDLIVIKQNRDEYTRSPFHIIKKFAFVPENPANRK